MTDYLYENTYLCRFDLQVLEKLAKGVFFDLGRQPTDPDFVRHPVLSQVDRVVS